MATVISRIGDKRFEWTFAEDGSISLGGKGVDADIKKISAGRYSILLEGKSFHVAIDRNDLMYNVVIDGNIYNIEVETLTRKLSTLEAAVSKTNQPHVEVRSPMPGMVVRCEVREGEKIVAGDGLLILEAMKMENEIRATKEGTIKKILVVDMQVVDKGELLLLIG